MTIALPSVDEVRAIVPAPNLTDAQVQSYIDDASLIAEPCLTQLSDTRQKAIVKWLSAHLLTIAAESSGAASGVIRSESLGQASVSYDTVKFTDMLKGTAYGQQAMLLDPCGCLANLGKRGTKFVVIGQNRSKEYFDPTLQSD